MAHAEDFETAEAVGGVCRRHVQTHGSQHPANDTMLLDFELNLVKCGILFNTTSRKASTQLVKGYFSTILKCPHSIFLLTGVNSVVTRSFLMFATAGGAHYA